jgi:hypothetical protein
MTFIPVIYLQKTQGLTILHPGNDVIYRNFVKAYCRDSGKDHNRFVRDIISLGNKIADSDEFDRFVDLFNDL